MALREKIATLGMLLETDFTSWSEGVFVGESVTGGGVTLERDKMVVQVTGRLHSPRVQVFYQNEEVFLSEQEERYLSDKWKKRVSIIDERVEKKLQQSSQAAYDKLPL